VTGDLVLDTSAVIAVLRRSLGAKDRLATAAHYGRLKALLARAGTPIPENDLWIASLALERGWPLATRDAHFGRVPGLVVHDWR
jgi:hypothetical protein